MSTSSSLLSAVRRSLTLAAVAGSALAVAGAQTPASATAAPALSTAQPINFQSPVFSTATVGTGDSLFSSSSSSSSDSAQDAGAAAANTNLASLEKNLSLPGVNAQYGRRRYGAPRYRGGNTNADGSEKYFAFGGAGFTVPVTNNSSYLTTSYGFQVGVGRNFNKHLGLSLDFDWDKFGFTGSTIGSQNTLYQFLYEGQLPSNVDGNSHIWSFTLNPTYTVFQGDKMGMYVVVGGGFYHKTGTFTVEGEAEGFDPYYGEYEYTANEPIDSYTSNAAGVNGGVGFTYKLSKFANERLYGEVRLVHTFNSYRQGATVSEDGSGNIYVSNYNFFPQNSLDTTYLPVKFGIRF